MVSLTTPLCDFGWNAPDFDLPATDGRRHALESVRGPNGLLLMFICNHCPYVKAVIQRIVRDCLELKAYGIGSVAIMPNDPADYPEDSFDNMARLARKLDFPFPYLLDASQDAARAYGAVCTPDFFGFNGKLQLQYRGRLDASRKETAADARRDLFEAMRLVARSNGRSTDELSLLRTGRRSRPGGARGGGAGHHAALPAGGARAQGRRQHLHRSRYRRPARTDHRPADAAAAAGAGRGGNERGRAAPPVG
jgi:peroxiredoxin